MQYWELERLLDQKWKRADLRNIIEYVNILAYKLASAAYGTCYKSQKAPERSLQTYLERLERLLNTSLKKVIPGRIPDVTVLDALQGSKPGYASELQSIMAELKVNPLASENAKRIAERLEQLARSR